MSAWRTHGELAILMSQQGKFGLGAELGTTGDVAYQ
jgi:hypothetical protein